MGSLVVLRVKLCSKAALLLWLLGDSTLQSIPRSWCPCWQVAPGGPAPPNWALLWCKGFL